MVRAHHAHRRVRSRGQEHAHRLALFQPATTQVTKLTGQFSADVRLRGTLESPRLNGLVETANGGFSVPCDGRDLHQRDRATVVRGRSAAGGSLRAERRRPGPARGHRRIGHRAPQHREGEPADIDSQFKVLDNEFGDMQVDSERARHRRSGEARPSPEKSSRGPARLEVDQILEQLSRSAYSTEATVATEHGRSKG